MTDKMDAVELLRKNAEALNKAASTHPVKLPPPDKDGRILSDMANALFSRFAHP